MCGRNYKSRKIFRIHFFFQQLFDIIDKIFRENQHRLSVVVDAFNNDLESGECDETAYDEQE